MSGNLTEEEMVSDVSGRVLMVFYCLIFVFGFLGNAMVIYVAIRKKNYRNVTNCYVINLAIADLLFLTLAIPFTAYLGVNNTDPFGDTVCKIYTYLAYRFLQATCNILAVMSIDRYLYIVRSKSKLGWRTPRNAFIVCIILWICSLTLIIPYHVISRVLLPNRAACGMNEHGIMIVCLIPFCSYYAVPLAVIIVCYTKLALHVIRTSRNMAGRMGANGSQKTAQSKPRRVTRMVIVVTLAFAVCWLPIHILELIKCSNASRLSALIGSYPRVLYTIRAVTHALAYFNSCLNPYLYALLNRNFCKDLVDILPAWKPCRKGSPTPDKDHSDRTEQLSPMSASKDRPRTQKYEEEEDDDEDEDDEIDYNKRKQITDEGGCQQELLRIRTVQDISPTQG